ncbi:MAG TPA: hypothetical protein VIJ94_07910 [Caulobacteraceae bacterium]
MTPAFDCSDEFAIDKPACTACPNLDGADLCRIHDRLEPAGFKGCVLYDCLGAGQRVVQEVFAGASWRQDPSLLPAMGRALVALRGVHELIQLLQEAAKAPLTDGERLQLEAFGAALEPAGGWSEENLEAFAQGPAPGRVRSFLKSLRWHFSAEPVGGEPPTPAP